MSYRERYTCNICGAERGPTNHWFEVYTDTDMDVGTLVVRQFIGLHGSEHICSSACLGKRVHQFEEALRKQQKGN